jgi:hypothetical protein
MSEASDATPKRHIVAWLGAITSLPLLYFLSVPWVLVYGFKHIRESHPFIHQYVAPQEFVFRHSPDPIQYIMMKYGSWCFEVSGCINGPP